MNGSSLTLMIMNSRTATLTRRAIEQSGVSTYGSQFDGGIIAGSLSAQGLDEGCRARGDVGRHAVGVLAGSEPAGAAG